MVSFQDIKTATDVFEQLKRGSPISDADLVIAIAVLRPVVNVLYKLGPTFHLTWKELHFETQRLEDMQELRKRSRT